MEGGIRGHGTGFVDFWLPISSPDWGIGSLLLFRSRIPGERPAGFVTLLSDFRPPLSKNHHFLSRLQVEIGFGLRGPWQKSLGYRAPRTPTLRP